MSATAKQLQQQASGISTYLYLVGIFCAWRALLFAIALSSPGDGYDTSTRLTHELLSGPEAIPSSFSTLLFSRLTRWDGIYYTAIATRGYLHEQEWAFGWGFTRLVAHLAPNLDVTSTFLVAISLANVSHLLSVLLLHSLALLLLQDRNLALIAATLHVITPAGLFMCAPFSEGLCSLLNFFAFWLYVQSRLNREASSQRSTRGQLCVIAAGFVSGLATTVRSNGVLNGILFAFDCCEHLCNISRKFPDAGSFLSLVTSIFAGLLNATGFVLPQYIAYREYCVSNAARPWCSRLFPSIYSFVQDHYWNVGFLRYWTFSNLPLFILAAPMLALMIWSALTILMGQPLTKTNFQGPKKSHSTQDSRQLCLQVLAMPQLFLAVTAATSFHIQIINRIATGYPLIYLFTALVINGAVEAPAWMGKLVVYWMVLYGLIQGALFASFLPPA